ncbi:Ppx/GppA phosphatase family protein [Streptomyces sp. RTd22]|uniref:Ppx/GppA phosphatase family protein n=1 Tax=Streptomyces sp. RTd22 TaxID=1841249 RepID=UPI0007C4A49D|nr:Ppx/GppA phosphatase family protein [Streptomyces sp. RTd22]
MRLAVLDIGSRSVHLKIADLVPGGPPEPVATLKQSVHLAEATDRHGVISQDAIRRLVGAVTESEAVVAAHQVDDLVPLATSAVRDAANRNTVLAAIEDATGVRVRFFSGEEEARLTFLAARGWHGWSAGQMLLLDIGGGSMELACGSRTEPAVALSLPLGAGRLTRHHLPDEAPVHKRDVARLRKYVRSVLMEATAELRAQPVPVSAIATSKTFTQLARLTGAPKPTAGAPGRSTLARSDLRKWVPRLAARSDAERARLTGISASRAHQSLAGAIVAETAMELLDVRQVTICPWALREGVLLDRLAALGTPPLPAVAVPRARNHTLHRLHTVS